MLDGGLSGSPPRQFSVRKGTVTRHISSDSMKCQWHGFGVIDRLEGMAAFISTSDHSEVYMNRSCLLPAPPGNVALSDVIRVGDNVRFIADPIVKYPQWRAVSVEPREPSKGWGLGVCRKEPIAKSLVWSLIGMPDVSHVAGCLFLDGRYVAPYPRLEVVGKLRSLGFGTIGNSGSSGGKAVLPANGIAKPGIVGAKRMKVARDECFRHNGAPEEVKGFDAEFAIVKRVVAKMKSVTTELDRKVAIRENLDSTSVRGARFIPLNGPASGLSQYQPVRSAVTVVVPGCAAQCRTDSFVSPRVPLDKNVNMDTGIEKDVQKMDLGTAIRNGHPSVQCSSENVVNEILNSAKVGDDCTDEDMDEDALLGSDAGDSLLDTEILDEEALLSAIGTGGEDDILDKWNDMLDAQAERDEEGSDAGAKPLVVDEKPSFDVQGELLDYDE